MREHMDGILCVSVGERVVLSGSRDCTVGVWRVSDDNVSRLVVCASLALMA